VRKLGRRLDAAQLRESFAQTILNFSQNFTYEFAVLVIVTRILNFLATFLRVEPKLGCHMIG
jgi:hypothetical protein